jgi:uncharacterized membrane protein required for colicin V production
MNHRSPTVINWLDLFIIAALAATILVGFIGGLVRLTAMAIAIYLGSVVAARWYVGVTDVAHRHINGFDTRSVQFFVFGALMIVTSAVMTWLLGAGFGKIRFPRRIEIADNVLGAGVGIIATALSLVPVSLVLQALNESVLSTSGGSILGIAQNEIDQSRLIPLFLRMAPVFVRLISPWLPSGIPPILSVVH